jgi:hypothetical protein
LEEPKKNDAGLEQALLRLEDLPARWMEYSDEPCGRLVGGTCVDADDAYPVPNREATGRFFERDLKFMDHWVAEFAQGDAERCMTILQERGVSESECSVILNDLTYQWLFEPISQPFGSEIIAWRMQTRGQRWRTRTAYVAVFRTRDVLSAVTLGYVANRLPDDDSILDDSRWNELDPIVELARERVSPNE